jgi:hypothetical protein
MLSFNGMNINIGNPFTGNEKNYHFNLNIIDITIL